MTLLFENAELDKLIQKYHLIVYFGINENYICFEGDGPSSYIGIYSRYYKKVCLYDSIHLKHDKIVSDKSKSHFYTEVEPFEKHLNELIMQRKKILAENERTQNEKGFQMNKNEIIVDKVQFIKRMAEKYNLIYAEYNQEDGEKDFGLYLDKEHKYKILDYDTYSFRSYHIMQSLAIDFMFLPSPRIKYGEYHTIISNDLAEQYIKTLKYTYDEFIRITDFITKEQKAENKLQDIKNDF